MQLKQVRVTYLPFRPLRSAPNLGTGYGSTPVRQLPKENTRERSIRKHESTATRGNRRRGARSVVGRFMNVVAVPVGEDAVFSCVRRAVLGLFVRYIYIPA